MKVVRPLADTRGLSFCSPIREKLIGCLATKSTWKTKTTAASIERRSIRLYSVHSDAYHLVIDEMRFFEDCEIETEVVLPCQRSPFPAETTQWLAGSRTRLGKTKEPPTEEVETDKDFTVCLSFLVHWGSSQ